MPARGNARFWNEEASAQEKEKPDEFHPAFNAIAKLNAIAKM